MKTCKDNKERREVVWGRMPLMLIEELMEASTIRNTTAEPSGNLLRQKSIKEASTVVQSVRVAVQPQEGAWRTLRKRRNRRLKLTLIQKLRQKSLSSSCQGDLTLLLSSTKRQSPSSRSPLWQQLLKGQIHLLACRPLASVRNPLSRRTPTSRLTLQWYINQRRQIKK